MSTLAPATADNGKIVRDHRLDDLRALAVLGTIALHVMLTNNAESSLACAHPAFFAGITSLAQTFSNQTFVFVALYLGLSHPSRGRITAYVAGRLGRLVPPYLLLTILYVAIDAATHRAGPLYHFPLPQALLLIVFAGAGAYHLHFLPALILLTSIARLLAFRVPWWFVAIALAVGTIMRSIGESMIVHGATDAGLSASDVLTLHGLKMVEYAPYGILAGHLLRNRIEFPTRLAIAFFVGALALQAGIAYATTRMLCTGLVPGLPLTVSAACSLTSVIIAGILLLMSQRPDVRLLPHSMESNGLVYSRAFLVLMLHPAVLTFFQLLIPDRRSSLWQQATQLAFALGASWLIAGLAIHVWPREK